MKAIKIFLILLVGFSLNGYSGVNLKNGNFYVSYTDVDMVTPFSAISQIKRTYNSRSIGVGVFGYGWASKFETYLVATPEGSITIHEHGLGARILFKSNFMNDESIEEMIDQIIEIAIAESKIKNSPSEILKLSEKLLVNQELRHAYWASYIKKGYIEHYLDFPEGMKLESSKWYNRILTRKGNTFIVKTSDSERTFNNKGQLIKIDEGNNKVTILEYQNGFISKLTNHDKSEITFKTNEKGLVTELKASNGEQVRYIYNENDDLIRAEDIEKNYFMYAYDEKHNLSKITYMDGSSKVIKYHDHNFYAKSVKKRNGDITEYDYKWFYYDDGTINKLHYGVSVTKEGFDGNKYTNYFEWERKRDVNGTAYDYIVISEINGVKTKTVYSELCEDKPLEITRGGDETTFKYNNRCLLVEKKSSSDGDIYMQYHPTLEKITQVKKNDFITDFKYNDKGELIYAKDQTGKWVELKYVKMKSGISAITSMKNNEGELLFEYNKNGKPIKISIKDLGEIDVKYDAYGKIESVNSKQGPEMSFKVTQAFQSLLELIKPSGVNFNL